MVNVARKLHSTFLLIFTLIFSQICFAEIETQTAFSPAALFQNAIKAGQVDDVQVLIHNGADVNQTFEKGITPLHLAIINDQENIAKILIESGARISTADTNTNATPLHMAALYGRLNIASLLIEKGADVNAIMKFNITPLQVATQFNQPKIVELLLKSNTTKVDLADQDGFTALHFAAQNGNEDIAKMLLDRGANVNAQDKTKNATPLMIASENNHPKVVHLLHDKGGK